jgi:hypothetical protein
MRVLLNGLRVNHGGSNTPSETSILEYILNDNSYAKSLINNLNVVSLLDKASRDKKFVTIIHILVDKLNNDFNYSNDTNQSDNSTLGALSKLLLANSTRDDARTEVFSNLDNQIILRLMCRQTLMEDVYFLCKYLNFKTLEDLVLGDYSIFNGSKMDVAVYLILYVILRLEERCYTCFSISMLDRYLLSKNYKNHFLEVCFESIFILDVTGKSDVKIERVVWLINELLSKEYISRLSDTIKDQITENLLLKLLRFPPISRFHQKNYVVCRPQLFVKLTTVLRKDIHLYNEHQIEQLEQMISMIDIAELWEINKIFTNLDALDKSSLNVFIRMVSDQLRKVGEFRIELKEITPIINNPY